MQGKVLEIRDTRQSPIRNRAINQYFCIEEVLKIPEEFNEILISPSFEPIGFIKTHINTEKYIEKTTEKAAEKVAEKITLDPEKLSKKQLKKIVDQLENEVTEKKGKYDRKYLEFCKSNDLLKKNLEKGQKELTLDIQDLLRYNSKKITDLRKEISNCESDIFLTKQRKYALDLEIGAIEKEIENITLDAAVLEADQKKVREKYFENMRRINRENEELVEENSEIRKKSAKLLEETENLLGRWRTT